MLFRPITLDDLKSIQAIQNEDFKTTWDERNLSAEIKIHHPASQVLVEKGRICGFIFVRTVGGDWEITSMAVSNEFRRKGWGKALVAGVVEMGRKNHIQRVLLEVSAQNSKALNLYEHLGFTPGRVRKGYYSDGSDALEMSLTIAVS